MYAEVLEAHFRRYGTKGAVLLCSLHSYKNFLRAISSKPEKLLPNDFAILEFDGFKLAATFDNSKLHFYQIDYERIDSNVNLNHDAFVDIMSSLAQTPIGALFYL